MSTELPEGADAPEIPTELAEEQSLGGSPGAAAANAALRALSRAARSFLIYEPHNAAIRAFLESYREDVGRALTHGPLALDVRPFEMVRYGEVVYLERDRGRSLAFRLFRDGVRKLTILPEVPWEELQKLLEILSIRYTGVRQQEDDIVTLLWKAGFTRIQISAVEGFVPDEDGGPAGEGGGGEGGEPGEPGAPGLSTPQSEERQGVRVEIPNDWDRPFPPLLGAKPIKYIPLPPSVLVKLHDNSSTLPSQCLRLVQRMLEVANDPTDPTTLEEVLPLVEEVRDFLLADGQLHWLRGLIDILQSLPEDHRKKYLNGFASEASLKKILHTVGKGVEEAPPELVALLESLPGEHVRSLVRLLATEKGESQRRVLRKLLVRFCAGNPTALIEGMNGADASLSRELLKVLEEAAPAQAIEAALRVADHPELELRLEVHRLLDLASGEPVIDALRRMLRSPEEELRRRAITSLVNKGDQGSFSMLQERLERGHPTEPEADALGAAMARLDPERARALFTKWVTPKGMIGRFIALPGQRIQWWGAVSGLGLLSGEVEPLIRGLFDRVDEDLRQHCVAVLVRRRKRQLGAT
ncbi:MAG TPA: hypothetical protein PLA94_05480 [Myxococcota bacterium]|nr:hypothetical protein [Myxococcota bacterium]